MRIKIICLFCIVINISLSLSIKGQDKGLIAFGEARFSGIVKGQIPENEKIKDFVLTVSNSITADRVDYIVKIQDDGSFALRIPVVGETYGGFASPFYQGLIPLMPNEETRLEINYDDKNQKSIYIKSKSSISSTDSQEIMKAIVEILNNRRILGEDYSITPKQFSNMVINNIGLIEKDIESRNDISLKAKRIIMNEVKLFYLTNALLDYKESIKSIYKSKHDNLLNLDKLEIAEPNLEYYSFLKYFDLNNTDQLSSSYYIFVLQAILNHPSFNIQPIGETDIDVWIDSVKNSIGELLAADSDFVYQLLASTSYSEQLNKILNKMKPLSDKQLKNIETYFSKKNKPIADILFAENNNLIALSEASKKTDGYTINETPRVNKGEVLDLIVSRYKGKVVVVDFWATWCGPCLAAMKQSIAIKKEYNTNDVAFVYMTTTSSPTKIWERAISNIGGEHYYLDSNIWDDLYAKYGIGGIPFYIIFDRQGKLVHKQTSYMGNEKLKVIIDGLISK